jgi:CBS-domain-containing membrane protein
MQMKSQVGEGYGFIECTVRQLMTWIVVSVNRRTTMRDLAALFEKHDFNAVPVIEDGKASRDHKEV